MASLVERWVAVQGFEGLYEVSNFGQVRSLDRLIIMKKSRNGHPPRRRVFLGRMLRASVGSHGYLTVSLCDANRKHGTKTIHRLVVTAFIGNIPDDKEVNHKDTDKKNNRVDNLEIASKSENCRHALINNLGHVKLSKQQIKDIKTATGKSQEQLAKEHNTCQTNISAIRRGASWTYL